MLMSKATEKTRLLDQAEKQPAGRSEWWRTCLIEITSLIGIGVLGMPLALEQLGWVPGMACLLLLAVGAMYSGALINRLVLHVTELTGKRPRDYADLGAAAYVARVAATAVATTDSLPSCACPKHTDTVRPGAI
jgi:hypothetical protein